ncbi:MAG: hypothetical protein ACYTGN_14575 [Planctomycetota bacterium]|jgi:hypothetical protein
MARKITVLLLVCAPVFAKHYWIDRLAGPDEKYWEQAHKVLLQQGSRNLQQLNRTFHGSKDEAAKKRLLKVIEEIQAAEPYGLQFSAGMPKMKLTRALVNAGKADFAVRCRNYGEDPVVIWPYMRLRVLDPQGKELKPSTRIGRHGRGRAKNRIDAIKWVTLQPGEAWSFTEGLDRYMYDRDFILGWKIEQPGKYTLEFTYHYSMTEAIKGHDKQWAPPKDHMVRKANELTKKFTTTMRVDP